MNSREMEYILTIAREKSFSRAAEKLYVTQPALSLFLSRLEESMQVRLFERTRRGLEPTYAGERYLEFARTMLQLERSFDQDLCDVRAERKGTLRIGTSAHIGSIVLPEVLTAFETRYPNVEAILTEGTSDVLERLIDERELDLALMHLPLRSCQAEMVPIARDRYVAAFSGESPLAARIYEKPGEARLYFDLHTAAAEPFILARPGQRVRQIEDRILANAKIKPHIRLETSSVQTALRFAGYGLGVTFLPESYIPLFNIQKHTCFCYLEDEFEAEWTFSVVYPEGSKLSAPAHAFLEETERLFGAHSGKPSDRR